MLEKFDIPLSFYVSYINIYLNTMYVCIHTCNEAVLSTPGRCWYIGFGGVMAACALREHTFRAVSSLQGKKGSWKKNAHFYKTVHSL